MGVWTPPGVVGRRADRARSSPSPGGRAQPLHDDAGHVSAIPHSPPPSVRARPAMPRAAPMSPSSHAAHAAAASGCDAARPLPSASSSRAMRSNSSAHHARSRRAVRVGPWSNVAVMMRPTRPAVAGWGCMAMRFRSSRPARPVIEHRMASLTAGSWRMAWASRSVPCPSMPVRVALAWSHAPTIPMPAPVVVPVVVSPIVLSFLSVG